MYVASSALRVVPLCLCFWQLHGLAMLHTTEREHRCGRGKSLLWYKPSGPFYKFVSYGELVCEILSTCYLGRFRFVPESPRFLVSKGLVGVSPVVTLLRFSSVTHFLFKESQAAKILAKYHANGGDEHDPLIIFEMAQIRHALNLEREINEKLTFIQLWSTPGNLKRLRIIIAIAIFSQWRLVFPPKSSRACSLRITVGMVWFLSI